jgi:hypothetical protein
MRHEITSARKVHDSVNRPITITFESIISAIDSTYDRNYQKSIDADKSKDQVNDSTDNKWYLRKKAKQSCSIIC